MKAYESHPHYPSKVRECSNFAIREIKKVCKDVGPRPAGYEGEKKSQDHVEALMTPIADDVKRESFTLSPKAFMSWVMIDGALALVAAILGILCFAFDMPPAVETVFRVVSVALVVLAVFFLLGEFLFYKQVLDVFFKKQESSNVICTRKAAGETKRRIIIGGHMDTAYEWR